MWKDQSNWPCKLQLDRQSRAKILGQEGKSYEEPHAGAQSGGREAVEWSDRVDVDGVASFACHDCEQLGGSVWL